jgi:hypothetical protein
MWFEIWVWKYDLKYVLMCFIACWGCDLNYANCDCEIDPLKYLCFMRILCVKSMFMKFKCILIWRKWNMIDLSMIACVVKDQWACIPLWHCFIKDQWACVPLWNCFISDQLAAVPLWHCFVKDNWASGFPFGTKL